MNKSKVVIIGDGAVGSTLAYTLTLKSNVKEIVILDVNKEKAAGDALDMEQGMPFISPKKIYAGTYEDVNDAHIVVITAGVGQKDGETRIDLLKRNIKVFDNILDNIKDKINDECIVLVVTNPVDILSYYTYKKLGISSNRVIGSGTVLDTARLKSLIAQNTKIDARNVHAFVLGEHGDSEFVAWSLTSLGGLQPTIFCKECGICSDFRCLNKEKLLFDVRNAAYEIIAKKGATFYAVGMAVEKIIESIINDTHSVLTVSSLIKEHIDIENDDCYLSIPCVVGAKGIERVLHPNYSQDEIEAFKKCSLKMKESIDIII